MNRANARINHPSLRGGRATSERASTSALLYRDVSNAWADFEHALEHYESRAATEAAFEWWNGLKRMGLV